jgi:hypothetical protein
MARVRGVSSQDEFNGQIRKNPLMIALFYTSRFDKKKEKAYGKDLKDARRAFESVSKIKRYEDGGVTFVSVDLAKKKLAGIEKRYSIGEVPAYIIFFRGEPFKDLKGMLVQHVGLLEKDEVSQLIERYLGKKITDYLKERSRLRQREREESQSFFSPYAYWGFGGGYPYGYPYYYYPPYGGSFGFSFGM